MNPKISNSKAVFKSIKSRLTLQDADEVQAIALAIMEKYYQLTLTDILEEKAIEEFDLYQIIDRVNKHEPLQYVLGEAYFYGRKFKVNPSVLIPRPETELLISEILQERLDSPRILDIGTGSGCIAVTLKLEIPGAEIYALDISEAALSVAKENSISHNTLVNFIQGNFIADFSIAPVDIIVSNPPYVQESEKKAMQANVLKHEPHLALFVSDDDPLLFYRTIAAKSNFLLNPGGKIFAEINEHLGTETANLFKSFGFNDVEIIQDLDNKPRIIKASH